MERSASSDPLAVVVGRRVAVGSDLVTAGTDALLRELENRGDILLCYGALAPHADVRWPQVGRAVAEAVAEGLADEGIVLCWTGTGVAIAANKVPGIRAALCVDAYTAAGARKWNDANVLAMSLRLSTEHVMREILDAWRTSTVENDAENLSNISLLAVHANEIHEY